VHGVEGSRTSNRVASVALAATAIVLIAVAGFAVIGSSQPYALIVFGAIASAGGVSLLFAVAVGLILNRGKRGTGTLVQSLLDGARNAIVVTDASGRAVYANRAYRDLINASADSSVVPPIERVFIGDPGVSEVVYRLLKAARERRRLQEEVRVAGASGEPGRWLRMRVRPLSDNEADSPMTVWIVADVTRELERQENAFQELRHAIDYLDHAPAGFFSVDGNGDFSYINATLAQWLDYDLAQVGSGGLKLADIIAGQGAALLTTLSGSPGEVKTEVLDIDLKSRSGRTLPVRLLHKVAFGPDGSAGSSRTLVLNRTRDRDADPLRAAEVRFMRFFHNTPMAIATVDKQGRIARSNALFARLFNPVLQGEPTHDRSILSVVAARERSTLEAAIRSAAEGQGEIAPVDAVLEGAGDRCARFYVAAVEEEKGDREAAIVYALDTTEQRALETQLSQQQKLETIGRLAGNVAHDFNNLLGAIMMATDFLLNAHRPTDPSFQDIMEIKQNANRAAALVRQLLAFSRKQTLRPQVLDLGEAVSDLSVLLRRLIGERIQLNVVHGRDLWSVKADIGQFEQSIINLAVNARDAMPNGGTLTLRTANIEAQECARLPYKGMPTGEYVLIEIADSGTGIAPEVIDKIFDPFYTTKEIGRGTGLGLASVYGFIKQTGGFIYVDSEVGNGATFRIFIPRHIPTADEAHVPHLPETAAPAITGASPADAQAKHAATDLTGEGTILLVEDEQGLRALNARGLSSRGYTVVEAGNGVEAIEALERREGKIDLVVSDVMMPEMDGPTLFKELRKRRPDIKIIFVSGYAEDAFQKNLPDPDQFDFLSKPFTLKQLVAQVKDTMTK
jgi:two-component system cell cycle sensor histidine kinase/response regulator CckA